MKAVSLSPHWFQFCFFTTTSLAGLFLNKQTILCPVLSVTFVVYTQSQSPNRKQTLLYTCKKNKLIRPLTTTGHLNEVTFPVIKALTNNVLKMTVATEQNRQKYFLTNQMGACKLNALPLSHCFSMQLTGPENFLFSLISSSLQVKLSVTPSLLLFLRSQEKWIILALSPLCSSINSNLPSPWSFPAASCYLTAWSAAKLIPHHNRSQLQVICHRRDSNPIMCTQKTLNHVQAHTDVHEACMHRC